MGVSGPSLLIVESLIRTCARIKVISCIVVVVVVVVDIKIAKSEGSRHLS